MTIKKTLFIFAGEPSGDLHGSKILASIIEKNPGLNITAVAGPLMQKKPHRSIFRYGRVPSHGFYRCL